MSANNFASLKCKTFLTQTFLIGTFIAALSQDSLFGIVPRGSIMSTGQEGPSYRRRILSSSSTDICGARMRVYLSKYRSCFKSMPSSRGKRMP